MNLLENLWNIIGFFFWTFVFLTYLMVLFWVVMDVFRDRELNGWAKAGWILFLVFVPFLTAVTYLIWRGQGMSERQAQAEARAQKAAVGYVRSAADASSADDIAKANALLVDGSITPEEYATLKARALR